eukprot:gene11188-12360_t
MAAGPFRGGCYARHDEWWRPVHVAAKDVWAGVSCADPPPTPRR